MAASPYLSTPSSPGMAAPGAPPGGGTTGPSATGGANNPNAPAMLTPDQFLFGAKKKRSRIYSGTPYLDGLTSTYALSQSGLLEKLWFNVQGTIVVAGTVTGGTFQTYPNPAPFSIIRRVRFGNNQGQNLRDMSGWSWYKWVRARTGIDFLTQNSGVKYSTNTLNNIGVNLSGSIVNGAAVAAQTYNVAISMPMPIAYNDGVQKGLLVLQVNTLVYNMQIDWGRLSGGIGATGGTNDLFSLLTGSGLSVTVTLNAWVEMDWFQPPMKGNLAHLLDLVMVVTDQTFPTLNSGDNQLKPPTNDFYTLLLLEFTNNNAPIAVANLQTIQWAYGGITYDEIADYQTDIVDWFYQHHIAGMDGVVGFDLGLTKGITAMRDTYNVFNNQNVTDLTIHVTVNPTLSLVTPTCIGVFEALRQMQQVLPTSGP